MCLAKLAKLANFHIAFSMQTLAFIGAIFFLLISISSLCE